MLVKMSFVSRGNGANDPLTLKFTISVLISPKLQPVKRLEFRILIVTTAFFGSGFISITIVW